MEFWYLLGVAVAFAALFPYIRCLIKRLICAQKIKKICSEKGYCLYATHPFWFLGGKRSKNCDFYVETKNKVFAVKFFGMPRWRSVLVLKENGEYFVRNFIALMSFGEGVLFPIGGKTKQMNSYNFRYKYREEWEIKTPKRVLLINPTSIEVRYQPRSGKELIVGAGNVVNGMEINSLPRFLGDLEGTV